jgi:hypothetical protein
MQLVFNLLLFVTFTFGGLSAFANDHAGHVSMDKVVKTETKRQKLESNSEKTLISILKLDEALHESFFKYDAALVEKNAKALAVKVDSVKDKKIKKLFKRTSKQLLKIKANEEKEKNYHLYGVVNKTLVEVLKKYDLGSDYNIYYCPMLKKSWVQNSKKKNKVHNPYAGDYMPHCGMKTTNF